MHPGEPGLVVDGGGLLLEQLELHEELLEPLVDEVQLVLQPGRRLQLAALPVRLHLLVHLGQQVLLVLELAEHRLKKRVPINIGFVSRQDASQPEKYCRVTMVVAE